MSDPSDKAVAQAFRECAPSLDIAEVTRIHNRARELDAAKGGEAVAWLLTDSAINSLQVASVHRLIDRAKHAHHTDLIIRINGQDEHYEADWLKHLTRATPPAQAAEAVAIEWRWVDERGRAMTNWKAGGPPPMDSVSDEKGTMRVEVRAAIAAIQAGE